MMITHLLTEATVVAYYEMSLSTSLRHIFDRG